jgi:hypothetical protein
VTPDEALVTAHTALRSDLCATNCWTPATEQALVNAINGRRAWLAAWPEGADHVPGLVAQDLQEAVHETIDATWPRCSEHVDHALFVEPDLGPDAFWVCHVSGLPVAAVGGL